MLSLTLAYSGTREKGDRPHETCPLTVREILNAQIAMKLA